MDTLHLERKVKRIIWKNCGEAAKYSKGNENSQEKFQDELNKRRRFDPSQVSGSPMTCNSDGPRMMPLLSIPDVEEFSSKASIVSSGTAIKGNPVPSVGAVDIGISERAYFFRVALPGVKKDPGEFRCEIERDGKVNIRGVTSTGGKTVARQSRVFEMKFQQQSPPGPFTLSFSLPGPVDPRLFYPTFRSDGILEAVVMKYE